VKRCSNAIHCHVELLFEYLHCQTDRLMGFLNSTYFTCTESHNLPPLSSDTALSSSTKCAEKHKHINEHNGTEKDTF